MLLGAPGAAPAGAASAPTSTSTSYVLDYAGTYSDHAVVWWNDSSGRRVRKSYDVNMSMSFDVSQTVTLSSNWYDPPATTTRLVLNGTVTGTTFSDKGVSDRCTATLTPSKSPQGYGTVVPSKQGHNIDASTELPGGDMVHSSDNTGLCAFFGGSTDSPTDPRIQGATKAEPSLRDALSPSLTLSRDGPVTSKTFNASLTQKTGTNTSDFSIRALFTVQAAEPYVALGDSFSSGAIHPLYGGQARCYRSSDAFPVVYDHQGIFLACSGAPSSQILSQQVPLVPSTTKLVSLTAGGDDEDINVGGVMTLCVLHQVIPLATCEGHVASAALRDGSAFSHVTQEVEKILEAVHEQAPRAEIYVLGYPIPLPERFGPGGCSAAVIPWTASTLQIADRDLPFLRSLGLQLNQAVERAARSVAYGHYVAPFTGHDICSNDSYFTPLATDYGPGAADAPLHPNIDGQRAMAHDLLDAAGVPPG